MADRSADQYKKWSEHRLLSGILTILQNWFYNAFSGATPFTQIIMRGLIDDATSRIPRIDPSTNAFITNNHEHHEIHDGDFYSIMSVAQITLGDVIDIRITVPAGDTEGHFEAILDVEGETNWWFFRGVAIVNAGAALIPLNRNFASINTSVLTFDLIQNTSIANANIDTNIAGIIGSFLSGIIGTGRGSLGQLDMRRELILNPGEICSLRFEAVAAGYINWSLNWYDYEPKD